MIQRTAASPLDGGRLIASVTPLEIKSATFRNKTS
jgi:hypothetical protein